LESLESNTLIRDALGPHVYERFMQAKQAEWNDYQLEVTAWELNKYINTY
jgi:glutamine synthetase